MEEARRVSVQRWPTSATLLHGLRIQNNDVYALSSDLGRYVPCRADFMAELPADHEPVPMLEVLPPHIAEKYRRTDLLLKQPTEIPEDYAYLNRTFSKFKGQASEWRRYLSRAEARPLWVLRPESEAIGCLAVA